MNEKVIEKKLIDKVKQIGGIALKIANSGYAGMPDRILLIAKGRVAFVEVKAPKKKPRKLQMEVHKRLMQLGFNVYVLSDDKQIGGIIDAILGT